VPIVTTTEIKFRPRETRDSVFKFIEAELTAARTDLPVAWEQANNGRMTKGAVDAILASMYLNAGVFKKNTGVSTTAYNSCAAVQIGAQTACDAAIAAANRILNAGVYQLADTFAQAFRADNSTSKENIFVIKFVNQAGLGLNFVMRALHYNQYTQITPWNGFATLAQTYNAFDAADKRRQVILAGPQVNVLTGVPVNDRGGSPLVFTTTISDITQATEGEGPRIYKWPADPAHVNQENGNDFAWFRLGEIYLIKAEALNELTPGSAQAVALLDSVRARKDTVAAPLSAVDRTVILNERLFELVGEGKRRQDLIRFGKYGDAWEWKPASAPHRILLPIPQVQMDANALLDQNPGY